MLLFVGLALALAGLFALFQAATGHFLPHDTAFLGMTSAQLCAVHGCRIVHFMIHDRVAFGGALVALGVLYLWLVESPLRRRQAWAWWLLVVSGTAGFASFLAYLGYGYLDTWHGAVTLVLLPCFLAGLARSWRLLDPPTGLGCLLGPAIKVPRASALGRGRALLLVTAFGLVTGGLTILVVGMTSVFVPQDLAYLGLTVEELEGLNPRLAPLIAHDRAGFGGAVCCWGITMFFCVWREKPSRRLWQVLCFTGIVGFGTAIGIHPAVGYTDAVHLAPAVVGALLYAAGLLLTFGRRGAFRLSGPGHRRC
jgi:hypothetical protein